MAESVLFMKRGDDLPLAGVVTIRNNADVDVSADTDFSSWSITAEVRSGPKNSDDLLATATIAFIGSSNEFTGLVARADTTDFPAKVYIDFRFLDDANLLQSTQTLLIEVSDAVTDAP